MYTILTTDSIDRQKPIQIIQVNITNGKKYLLKYYEIDTDRFTNTTQFTSLISSCEPILCIYEDKRFVKYSYIEIVLEGVVVKIDKKYFEEYYRKNDYKFIPMVLNIIVYEYKSERKSIWTSLMNYYTKDYSKTLNDVTYDKYGILGIILKCVYIIIEEYEIHKFNHNDYHIGNILYNKLDLSQTMIDTEFSTIGGEDILYDDIGVKYLEETIDITTPDILHLFDIYLLTVSFIDLLLRINTSRYNGLLLFNIYMNCLKEVEQVYTLFEKDERFSSNLKLYDSIRYILVIFRGFSEIIDEIKAISLDHKCVKLMIIIFEEYKDMLNTQQKNFVETTILDFKQKNPRFI